MTNGVRITEDGALRASEADLARATESFVPREASATFAGAGAVAAAAGRRQQAAAALTGTGSIQCAQFAVAPSLVLT